MIVRGKRTAMVSLGSGLQLAIVKMGDEEALVIEEIRPGGESLILGSATRKTIDGVRYCLMQIEGMCSA